jgi:uroporphyrinogen decarboxylase
VQFWSEAGYDYIPISVGMMVPGKVTDESKISKVLREMVLKKNPQITDPKAWNLEFTSFIDEKEDMGRFPWDAVSEIDLTKLRSIGELLPEGMKVLVVSGKIFTLTWMLMGFDNFAMKLVLEESLVSEVFERVATIQLKSLERIFEMGYVAGIWAVDDLAFGAGPMIAPDSFRKHVFPCETPVSIMVYILLKFDDKRREGWWHD